MEGLRELRRREYTITNRLLSIYEDYKFLEELYQLRYAHLPILGNQRCGGWYSNHFDGHCYFKSTDGHHGSWAFPQTRLNLSVAKLAAERGGVVIVDSTRSGKRFPDSLSKTIPIWCTVLNRAIWSLAQKEGVPVEGSEEDWNVVNLPTWVGDSECSQVHDLLPTWDSTMQPLMSLQPLRELAKSIKRPMRCLWIANETHSGPALVEDGLYETESLPFTPLICISVSEAITCEASRVYRSWKYIQGAADDHENWAQGLTPTLFWENVDELVELARGFQETAVEDMVQRLVKSSPGKMLNHVVHGVIGDTKLEIATSRSIVSIVSSRKEDVAVVDCGEVDQSNQMVIAEALKRKQLLWIPIPDTKRQKDPQLWQRQIKQAMECTESNLAAGRRVVFACPRGDDRSVAMCIAAMVAMFSENGEFVGVSNTTHSKEGIRRAYLYIQCFYPFGLPPRRMMQELSRYFITSVQYPGGT